MNNLKFKEGGDLIVPLHLNSDTSATVYHRFGKLKTPIESKFYAAWFISIVSFFFQILKNKTCTVKTLWGGHHKIVFRGLFSFPVQPDVVVYR